MSLKAAESQEHEEFSHTNPQGLAGLEQVHDEGVGAAVLVDKLVEDLLLLHLDGVGAGPKEVLVDADGGAAGRGDITAVLAEQKI